MRGLTRVLMTVLAFCLLLSLASCKKGSDVPLSAGLSMIEGEPVHDENVALRTDHFTVTPGMMAYFFYDYGGEVLVAMEQSKPFDPSKSLHDQAFDEQRSFYDVIMNATLQKVSELLIYCEAARAAGVDLTDDQRASIEQELYTLTMTAAMDSQTADAYLQARYGPLISKDAFKQVLELELLASAYSLKVNRELENGISEAQIEACAKEKGLNDTTPSRNMAYMVIPYVNGKTDEAKIGEVLAALQASPRQETLQAYSADFTIGSEANLTPDNVGITTIKEWLFDVSRVKGDFGRVAGEGCTYVVIYTDNGMSYGHVSARMYLYDAAYAAWYNGWVESLHFGYNYDVIDGYDVS